MIGLDFCDKVRKELGITKKPILIMTGKTDIEKINILFRSGASDFINKPFTNEELMGRIFFHLDTLFKMREADESLKESVALVSIRDEMLAICLHDLRNPLAVIMGNSNILKKSPNLKTQEIDRMNQLYRSC